MAKGIMYVDNIRVEFDDEATIMDVCRKAGVEMPNFCFHSDLSVYGACRMCMVDVACRFMQYTQTEFCGKCVPCREGTKRMNELLWAMRDYRLSESDFHMLTDLGEMISVTAFCNLGRNSYHTLETAIKYFPEEFKDHLRGDCALCELDREPIEPGGLPYNRIRLEIDPSICRGCSKCSRSCHAEAITGVIKSPFVIDPEKCVKCYTCIEACPFDAIQEVEIDG